MAPFADQLPPSLTAELSRQYDVVRMLGRGGMGVVWLARERSLDRLVAIKVLSGEAIESVGLRERFRREARVAARLVHPNIVPLHAFGETPDALYFVMGYVDGETLLTLLDREGRLERNLALRILGEIAEALAFAHREGVVHRDVKPENILLDAKSGRALLADFGVARIEGGGTSVTMTGVAVGTPSYMSPEQALGEKEIDGRSDIYALGVIGYRMLMGRLPFTAGTLQALLAQQAAAKPDDLSLAVAPTDRAIAQVIMRALEKDPTARWARADDLRAELESAARRGHALPQELERVQMLGTKMLFADVAIAAIFFFAAFWTPDFAASPEFWWILLFNLSFLPLISLAWAFPSARKVGWRETLRAMLHPPESWAHWWPRALRRPDDIWDRLPAPFRRVHNVIDGIVTYFVVDIAAFLVTATTGGGAWGDLLLSIMRWQDGLGLWLLGVVPKLFAFSWIGFEVYSARKKLGINMRELGELLGLPHLSSHPGWSKPKFARLLSAESVAAPMSHTPRTPAELAAAIVELNGRLRRGGLLPDDESARAAQSVKSAIESLEAEVQQLNSELDPAEGERLERRLSVVGADAELRGLLESQRVVLRRIEQRRLEKQARRDRLRDQLVTLWMQLVELDVRVTRGTAVDPELTGQVRALSQDLARAGEALTEAERVLARPTDRPRVTT